MGIAWRNPSCGLSPWLRGGGVANETKLHLQVGLQSDAVADIRHRVGLKSDLRLARTPLCHWLAAWPAGRVVIALQPNELIILETCMSSASPFRATLLALLLSTLAACNDSASNDEPVASSEPINPQAVQAAGFATLSTVLPGFDDLQLPANLVFRSAAEWQVAWLGHSQPTELRAPAPEVDFGKFMIVGTAKAAGGCVGGKGVARVEQSAAAITVHVWDSEPPPPVAVCTADYIESVHLALLPKSALPVQFVEHLRAEILPAWHAQLYTQAAPYENRMPQPTSNASPACTQLIVPFAVRGSGAGLPQSLKVNAVAVAQDGVTRWLQPASASETGITQGLISDSSWLQDVASGTAGIRSEPVLRGVARGCTSPQFKLDQPATVLLSVAAADGQAELVAQSTLTAAY